MMYTYYNGIGKTRKFEKLQLCNIINANSLACAKCSIIEYLLYALTL